VVAALKVTERALAQVRSEHSSDFLRLTRSWQHPSGYSLNFAVIDNPEYRDELVERLNALHPAARIDVPPTADPYHLLAELGKAYASGDRRVHVCAQPATQLSPTWWQQANVLREQLADAFPALVVLWLSDTEVDTAANHAPDFWNWRHAVLSFTANARIASPVVNGERFTGITDHASPEVVERLANIQRYITEHPNDSAAIAHLQLEAAAAHMRLGQWGASEIAARDAAQRFAQVGNAALVAESKGKIADILQARGQLDQALAIRENDELPVYERLGDVREAAVTRTKIADIYAGQGKLDEAKRIWRDEALPVFERIGYEREAEAVRERLATIQALRDVKR
jgi:tetratricopeptide (TPR) repeat protein